MNTTMTPEEMQRLRDQARAQGAPQSDQESDQIEFAHRQNAWDTGSIFPQSLPEAPTTPSTPRNISSTPAVRLPRGSLLPSDPEVKQVLTETANRYNINPALLLAVAQQESRYDPNAVGPQTRWGHASGMFQFLQDTARALKIDPLNWRQAADATARSLAEQIAKGGTDWAIATHFAGTNPAEHGPKTRRYVAEVSAKAAVIANELGIDYTPTNTTPELLRRLQSGQRPSDTGRRTPQTRQVPRASTTPQSGESPSNWHAPMLYRPGQAAQQTPTTRQSQPPRQLPRQVAPDNMSPAQMLALRNGQSPQATSPTDTQGNRESLWETLSRNVSEMVNPDDGDDGDDSWPFATPIVNAIERGWQGVQGLINRQTNRVTLSDADLQRRFEDQQSSMFSLKPRFRVGDDTWAQTGDPFTRGLTPIQSSGPHIGLPRDLMTWEQFKASPLYSRWEQENRHVDMVSESQQDLREQWLERVRKDPTAISMLPARFSDVRDQVLAERAQAHGFAPSGTVTGSLQRFIEGFPNPLDALLGRSMPVNAVNYLANIPELERKRFEEGREITNALNAVNHPDQYSAEDLQHYTGMLQDWRQKTDPNVVHAWQNFFQAAQADPGNTALGFATSIMADPYLLRIPAGLGVTPIRGVRNLAGITTPMTRGLAGADAIIDGTISTAAVNTAIGITSDLATTGQVNTENAQLSAALGALFGAGGGGLAFLYGARAHLADIEGARASGKLDELLQAKATGEVAVENAVETLRTPEKDPRFAGERNPTITPMQRRIAELTGIPLHDAEVPGLGTAAGDVYGPQVKSGRKIPTEGVEHFDSTGPGRRDEMISQWIKNRRAQVREAFTNEADYHQYQQYVAAERLRLAQEAAARAQQQEAAQAQARQADLERTNRFQQEFEAATRQRDEQLARGEVENAHGIALAEQARRDSADRLNASELFDAYVSQDQAAIRQAKANIDRRNGRGRFNQLGGTTTDYAIALGLVGAGALAGSALFPQDRERGAIAAALLLGLPAAVLGLRGRIGSVESREFRSPAFQEGALKLAGKLPKEEAARVYRTHQDVLKDALQGKFINRDVDSTTITHPATYSGKFIPQFAEIANMLGAKSVIDTMAGVGNIGRIKEFGYRGKVIANELEPEWAALHGKHGVDKSITGDGRNIPQVKTNSIDLGIVSPPYGNGLAESRLNGNLRSLTYANSLGRKLTEGNGGGMKWGQAYRDLHEGIYRELARIIKPGGHALINSKDFIKNGEVVRVNAWHIKAMEAAGFKLLFRDQIKSSGLITGTVKRPRVGYEEFMLFSKPDKSGKVPAKQRGQISEEMRTILGRAAIATTLAGAGYAMSPDEHRLAGGILGGLAGLVVPLGGGSRGSILSYFHNIGAIDADGLPRGIRTFGGKIADAAEDARLKARDDAWIKAAAAGDQRAFENLYRAYSDTTRRYVDRMIRSSSTRVANDADGVMNEAFFKVYQWMQENPEVPIDNFRDFVGQSARNTLLNELKAERTIKRDMPTVSEADANAELDAQGKPVAIGSSIIDQTPGTDPVSGKLIIDNVGETPEGVAMRDQLKDIIRKAVETQSDINQKVFTMRNFDNMSPQEVADALGISKNNVQVIDNRVKTRVQNAIVEKIPEVRAMLEDRYAPGHEPKPKVRGPAGQRGSATTGDMATVATLAAAVGAASYFMSDENTWGALVSGGIAAALAAVARGKSGRFGGSTRAAVALRAVDWRLKEFGEHFYGMAKEHGMLEAQAIAHYNNVTAPFSKWLNSLKPQVRAVMVEALSTRDEKIINGMLEHLGGQSAVEAFKPVRAILNNIEDTLVSLGIIKKSEVDYFPFRVKDLEGLRNALGIEQKDFISAALKAADEKMFKNLNRHLTQIEQDVIVNKLLEPYLGSRIGPQMPGFARARTIKTIPESLQQYYHDPITTLNSYGQQAIKYIHRAKFFGKHLKMAEQEGKQVVDISASIGELTRSLHEAGKLTEQQAFELASILQDRFNGGEQSSNTFVREVKNWSTASMLGQFVFSAVAQVNDLVWQIYRHGPRASIETAIRLAINKPLVRLKDFGITEHMVHEYISEGISSKVVKKSLLVSGMSLMDNAAKSFGLNAALIEYRNMVKRGVKGEARLREQFGRYFPDKIEKIISDLREGKITPDTELLAWTDLTDTQPLTAWELPQLYHHLPNGRIIYHLQTFNVRAGNLIYEEAIKNITSGNVKQVMKGIRALTGFAVVFGAGGVAGDKIKDLLRGRELKLNPWEIPLNLVQAAGGNIYNYRTHRANTPMEAVINRLPPAIGMLESAYQDPTTLIRRVPAVGEWIYNLNRPRLQAWNKDRVSKFDHSITINVEGRDSSSGSSGSSRNSRNSRRNTRRHY